MLATNEMVNKTNEAMDEPPAPADAPAAPRRPMVGDVVWLMRGRTALPGHGFQTHLLPDPGIVTAVAGGPEQSGGYNVCLVVFSQIGIPVEPRGWVPYSATPAHEHWQWPAPAWVNPLHANYHNPYAPR